jgi:NNP family nitrate/nitrite transporter-like MFS transporter
MFPLISFLAVFPVLYIGHFGDSFTKVIVAGFFLGLAGTVFAVGVPFVNAWYPPARRGYALGLFGIGMGGTAISALTTVRLANAEGRHFPFDLVAALLVVYAITAATLLRDQPDRPVVAGGLFSRTFSAMHLRATWELSFLYAVGFGGFVAFSVYLPVFLKNAYALTPVDAANRAAGFVLVAVVLRPVGGWLSDRFHPVPVLIACYCVVTAGALVVATHLTLVPGGTIAFLVMAAALGAAAGACFALVARVAPSHQVGAVTGVVGAAGGLGGFIPPLIMGAVYGSSKSYALGFILLAGIAACAATYTAVAMRDRGGHAIVGAVGHA